MFKKIVFIKLLFLASFANVLGQTNPTAFDLSSGSFSFTGFGLGTTTTYPTNMQGHRFGSEPTSAVTGSPSADFSLSVSTAAIATGSIRNEVSNGISILNSGSNHLGAIVVAINTSGRTNVTVGFTAEQLNGPNSGGTGRANTLRLQYRVGESGSFTDVGSTDFVTTNTSSLNAATNFSGIVLPAAVNGNAIVQLRWIYYTSSGTTGGRNRIRLDEISISSSAAATTNYYYKSPGSVLIAGNWTDDVTLAAGSNPSAVDATVTNAIWNFQNGGSTSLPGTFTLGTGSKIVVGGGASAFNLTVVSGTSITGGNGVDVAANGTLTLQHTTIPTLGTLSSGSTVDYAAASGTQTITATNYSNLTFSGSGTRTFPSGTVGISGTFTPGSFTTASAGTVDFNGTGAQTIPAFTYNNLTISGARTSNNITLANSATITVANTPSITATFTAGNGFVVTGSTVAYTLAGALTIPILTAVTSGNNYNNLTISGNTASNKTFTGSNSISIGGTLTTSNTNSGNLILNNTSTARTITIHTWNHSSGSVDFGTSNDAGSSGFTSTTNITNTLNKTGGTFTNTASTDFYRINFIGTTASISNSSIINFCYFTVNNGTTATLNTNLPINGITSGTGILTINGTLIAGSNLISTNTAGCTFVIGSNGVLRTTNENGLSGGASTTFTSANSPTLTLNSGSTIEYNGASQAITARSDYQNVTVSASGTNTISGTTTISGTLTLTSGTLAVGSNTLTLNGGYIAGTVNNLTTTSSSNLVFNTTAGGILPNFTAINNLTCNSTGNTFILNSSPTISGALTLTSGKLNIDANTLTLAGTVSGMSATNCLVTNNAATNSNLVVNGNLGGSVFFDQTNDANRSSSKGTNALANLTIGTSGNIVLGNKVNLFGALDFGSGNGTLSSGDGLLAFRNTSSGTSRLAAVTGSPTITGTVIVENYINNANRGWRLLTSPLTSAGSGGTVTPSVQSNWQSAMGYSGNYGTNFYSPSGLNGMDGTSNRNSLLRFLGDTATVGGWTNINTTGVDQFNADAQNGTSSTNPVFFAFVRGDKTVIAVPNGGSPNAFVATTLAAKGRITFGSKTITLVGKTNGYTAIGNPFISPVDLSVAAATATGLTGTYYYYNPANAAWVSVSSSNSWASVSFTRNMQTGVAVLAQFNGLSSGSIQFTEASKVSDFSTVQTGTGNGLQDNMRINLFNINSTSGTKTQLDELFVGFKTGYNAGFINTEDGEKMLNAGENLSSRIGNKLVAIDVRPYIQNHDSIFMSFTNTRVANYEFEFDPSNFDATVLDAKLADKFLNTETPLSLSAKTTVPFSVTATTGSNAADRFMIVFRGTGALPNKGFTVTGEKLGTNKVKVNWEAQAETGVREYALEKSTDGVNYQTVNTQAAKNGNVSNSYTYTDNTPVNGVNYYRVKTTQHNDIERYSTVITVNFKQQSTNNVVVYPNPVKGNTIGLQLQDLEKGMYSVRILSIEGKEVYKQQLQVNGSSLNTTINPSTKLAQGTYTLQVVGKSTTYTQKVVVE